MSDGTKVCEQGGGDASRPMPSKPSPPRQIPLPQPSSLAGFDVLYFERESDGGAVKQALISTGIAYRTLPGETDQPANVVTCTPDVPASAVKKLVSALIASGVEIRAIRPSIYSGITKKITIERYGGLDRRRVLTLDQIDSLDECPSFDTISQGAIDATNWHLAITNRCFRSSLNVVIVYYDGISEEWKRQRIRNIKPGESRDVIDDTGEHRIKPGGEEYYYFAAGQGKDGTNVVWEGKTGSRTFDAFDYGNRRFRTVRAGIDSLTLTCPN